MKSPHPRRPHYQKQSSCGQGLLYALFAEVVFGHRKSKRAATGLGRCVTSDSRQYALFCSASSPKDRRKQIAEFSGGSDHSSFLSFVLDFLTTTSFHKRQTSNDLGTVVRWSQIRQANLGNPNGVEHNKLKRRIPIIPILV